MRCLPFLLALFLAVPASAAPAAPGAPAKATKPEANDHDDHDDHDGHDHGPADEGKEPENESLVDYLWRKSDVAFHAGDYDRAVGLHKAIVIIAPEEVESYSVGAWLMWSMGKGGDAVDFIAKGLQANPKDPEMWDAAGQHYDLQKRVQDSKSAYAKAVELAGKDAPQMLRRRYAHAAEKAGDLPGSLAIWQKLVADYPTDVVNKNNLARVERTIAEKKGGAPLATTRS